MGEIMVEWIAFDVKAKTKVKLLNPKIVKLKNGRWAVKGKSEKTGITLYRFLSNEEVKKYVKK